MKHPVGLRALMFYACMALLAIALNACAGQQANSETDTAEEKAAAPVAVKLPKSYTKLMCYAFSSTPEIAKDYPAAAGDVQHSMMTALSMKNSFSEIGMAKAGKADAKALLLKATVTEMRIVSSAARIWGGVFAGSSNVALDLELIDGATGKVVRQEKLSTANNAWGATYSGGSTDHSMLNDMGKIVADYIAAVNSTK
ncbi:MAG: hypothetical protein VR64_19395 [Desulfatitalea sp. BRH_c12]|nr:MAG: hypothetical protein VR64_19395 [Desulfatitalea sp. BRH_c12]